MQLIQNKGLMKKVPKGKPAPSNRYKLWKQVPPKHGYQNDILAGNALNVDREDLGNAAWYEEIDLSSHDFTDGGSKANDCTSVSVYEDYPDTLVFKSDVTDKVINKTVIDGDIFQFFISANFKNDGQVVVLFLAKTLEVRACIVILTKKNKVVKKPINTHWNSAHAGDTLISSSLVQEILQEKLFNPKGLNVSEFDYRQLTTESATAILFSTFEEARVGSSYIDHASKGLSITQVCNFAGNFDTVTHGGAIRQKIIITYKMKLSMRNNGNLKPDVWMTNAEFSLTDAEVSLSDCDGKPVLSSALNGNFRVCVSGLKHSSAYNYYEEYSSVVLNFKLPMVKPYEIDKRLIAAGKNLYVCSGRQIYVYNNFHALFAENMRNLDVLPVKPPLQWHQNVLDRFDERTTYSQTKLLPNKKELQRIYLGNFKYGKEVDLGTPRHLLELDENTIAIHLCKLFEVGLFEVFVFASYVKNSSICTAIHAVCAGKVIFKTFVLGKHIKSILDFKFTKTGIAASREGANVVVVSSQGFEITGILTVQLDNGDLIRFDVFPSYNSSCVVRDLDREDRESEGIRLTAPGRRLSMQGGQNV
jgi:hypothetical protein